MQTDGMSTVTPAIPPAKIPMKLPCKIPTVAAARLSPLRVSPQPPSSQPQSIPEHALCVSPNDDAPHAAAHRSRHTTDAACSKDEAIKNNARTLRSPSISSMSSSASSKDTMSDSSDTSSSLSSTTSSSLSSSLSRSSSLSSSSVGDSISGDAELADHSGAHPSQSLPIPDITVSPPRIWQNSTTEAVATAKAQEENAGNGAAVIPPRPHVFRNFPSDLDKAIERFKDRLNREENTVRIKDDNKCVSLGTSKDNYIDPRIICSWADQQNVPIKKIFSTTRMKKFQWALNEKGFKF